MQHELGSPYPSEKQELLLKAALLEGDEMLMSWEEWKSNIDFEKDIEHSSFRMLPLLYQNLQLHKIDDPLMPRLKGIYRKSWSNNHILFHEAGKVLSILDQANIPTIVLKGISLSILTYKNYSVRPMSDMDILIPVSLKQNAYELLKEAGWESMHPNSDEYYLKYGISVTFINSKKTELDLHWHPFFESLNRMSNADFWDKAISLEVSGIKTKALCNEDELLLAFVHGLVSNPLPPIRWIADAVYLIKNNPEALDWERILFYSQKFRVIMQLKEALDYLKNNFHVIVPSEVLEKLDKFKPSFADRMVYKHAKKKGVVVLKPSKEKLLMVYAEYLRQTHRRGFISQNFGFIGFMRKRIKGKSVFRILIYYMRELFRLKGK